MYHINTSKERLKAVEILTVPASSSDGFTSVSKTHIRCLCGIWF